MLLFFARASPTDSADTAAVDTWVSPEAIGPHLVGSTSFDTPSRDGLTLPTQVWYPTATAGDQVMFDGAFPSPMATDGTPDCTSPRPVLLFSHGYAGVRYQSFYLTEFLTSHGWVVAAPDHVYNTFLDLDDDLLAEVAIRRPRDIADVYDALLTQSALADCIDPEAGYHVAGHSFGGYTALAVAGDSVDLTASAAACAEDVWLCDIVAELAATYGADATFEVGDPRARSVVAMAPAAWSLLVGALDAVEVPTLLLAGDEDYDVPIEEIRLIRGAVDGSEMGVMAGASHYTFSDACALLPTDQFCAGTLDLEVAHESLRALTTATLRAREGDTRSVRPEDPLWTWE